MVNYIKDTNKYWQAREQSRIALDSKRARAPLSEKRKMAGHIASDVRFLKTGRVISSKH